MINSFIPELWEANLLIGARKALVYGQPGVINRNYEGQFAQKGDTVHITGIGPVTVGDYVKGSDMGAPEQLSDAEATLTISQQKYFNFAVEDLDRAQAAGNFEGQARDEAMYALADARDQYIAGLWNEASAQNRLGTTAAAIVPVLTAAAVLNIFNVLIDCATLLTNSKVPTEGRFIIIPPWIEAMITKEFHMSGASAPGLGTQAAMNGFIGRVAGFDVLVSHNVPRATATTLYRCIFGSSKAITFADQINKVEAIRDPDQFRDVIRGLDVYGAKVVQPDYLGVLTASVT